MVDDPRVASIIQLLREDRNKGAAQELLKAKGLPFSGSWKDVERHIEESITDGAIPEEEWVDLVDTAEEAGYQHVFLYHCRRRYLETLAQEGPLREKAKRAGLEHLWNRSRLLLMPETPTVVSISQDERHLKFKWVERRVWKERLEQREETDEDRLRVITEYRMQQARGVIVFKLDLTTGLAQFRIERFKPSDRDNSYQAKLEFYIRELQQFVDQNQLEPLYLAKAVDVLNDPSHGEFRRRDSRIKTQLLMTLGAKSPRGVDVNQERMWVAAIDQGEGQYVGSLAYVEWLPDAKSITKDIGVKVFRDSNEVIVFPKCSEAELEHVLSRIIEFN